VPDFLAAAYRFAISAATALQVDAAGQGGLEYLTQWMQVVVGNPLEKGQFSFCPERLRVQYIQQIFQLLPFRWCTEAQYIGSYLASAKRDKDPYPRLYPAGKGGRHSIMKGGVQGKRDSNFDNKFRR
jgi:hypothetical protein